MKRIVKVEGKAVMFDTENDAQLLDTCLSGVLPSRRIRIYGHHMKSNQDEHVFYAIRPRCYTDNPERCELEYPELVVLSKKDVNKIIIEEERLLTEAHKEALSNFGIPDESIYE